MQQQDLFHEEKDKSLLAAFAWWEKKRVLYNIIVGVAGIIVLLLLPYFSILDLLGVIIYGVIVNLFYSLGFLIEVAARHYFKSDIDFTEKRETFFGAGLIFSVLVTLGIGFLIFLMQFAVE